MTANILGTWFVLLLIAIIVGNYLAEDGW